MHLIGIRRLGYNTSLKDGFLFARRVPGALRSATTLSKDMQHLVVAGAVDADALFTREEGFGASLYKKPRPLGRVAETDTNGRTLFMLTAPPMGENPAAAPLGKVSVATVDVAHAGLP